MPGSPGGKEVGRLNLKVLPDTSEFLDELKAFAERVEAEVSIELDVHLNDESARAELKELQARMDAADLQAHIDVEVDGAGALAHLDVVLAAMQGTALLNPIEVDIDVNSGAEQALMATNRAISQGSAAASHMGTQIALWGPLIFVAAVGIAALAPALLTILPLIAGVVLGVGAIAAGWEQVKDVFGPVVDGFKDMRKEIGLTLTAGLKPLVSEFVSGFMPVLKDGLMVGADLMNTLLKSVLGFLNSAAGISLIGDLFAGLGPALEPLMQSMGPLLAVLVRLSIAALPGLQMMSEAIARVLTDLNGFLAAEDIGPVIAESMSDLGSVLSIVGKLLRDMFGPLMAAAPGVIAMLAGIGETLGAMFQVLEPVFSFMSQHTGTMALLGSVLTVLAVGFAAVAAATALWNIALNANPIARIVILIAAVAAGLVYAYTHFEGFRNVVNGAWDIVKRFGSALASMGPALKIIGVALGVLVGVLAAVRVAMIAVNIVMALNPFTIIVLAIAALVAGLIYAYQHFEGFRNVVNAVFTFVKNLIVTVVAFIIAHWQYFALALVTVLTGPIGLLVGLIVMHFSSIKAFVLMVWSSIVAFLSAVLSRILGVFQAGWGAVKAVVSAAVNVVKAVVSAAISAVLAYVRGVSAVVGFFRNAFNSAKSAVSTAITGVINLVKDIPGDAKAALGNLGSTLTSAGKELIQGFINGIGDMFGKVKGKLGDLTGKLTSWKGPESLDKVILFDAGSFVIQGFLNGLESEYGAVEKSLGGFTNDLASMASFDAEGALKVSTATGVLPQLDSLLSMDVGAEATKLIIENWDTGVGHMRNIAADAVEGYEEATMARSNPEETP